jgi:hypothetical protein
MVARKVPVVGVGRFPTPVVRHPILVDEDQEDLKPGKGKRGARSDYPEGRLGLPEPF